MPLGKDKKDVLPSGGAAADFAVVAGWGIRTVAFALLVVAARAVMCFPGGGTNPVFRIFVASLLDIRLLI